MCAQQYWDQVVGRSLSPSRIFPDVPQGSLNHVPSAQMTAQARQAAMAQQQAQQQALLLRRQQASVTCLCMNPTAQMTTQARQAALVQ